MALFVLSHSPMQQHLSLREHFFFFFAKGLFQILPTKYFHLATHCVCGELICLPDWYLSNFLRALLTHVPQHIDNICQNTEGEIPMHFPILQSVLM